MKLENTRSLHRLLFPTAHRLLLNRAIQDSFRQISGDVLVVGAGTEPYRKIFQHCSSVHLSDVASFRDDLDSIADVHRLPYTSESFSAFVAMEVFEHLRNPTQAVQEAFRVLRPRGQALISIPFMFHAHGCPDDFQRYTDSGLKVLFSEFRSVSIKAFGNRLHAISDIISTTMPAFAALRIFNHFICTNIFYNSCSADCPSGYIVLAKK